MAILDKNIAMPTNELAVTKEKQENSYFIRIFINASLPSLCFIEILLQDYEMLFA